MKLFLQLFIVFLPFSLFCQTLNQIFNLELSDGQGSPIAYASVYVEGDQIYLTNEEGKCGFIFQSASDFVKISISHVAYESMDTCLQFIPRAHKITLNNRTLETVEIIKTRLNSFTSVDGATQLSRGFVELIPSATGSSNFTMALKTLPGVQTSYDFSSGFVVRGGDLDQNQVLIDNVYLYNLNHIGGLFPIVNNEILKSVNFYNGPIPSHLGGRISSFTVLETRTPNLQYRSTKIRIGQLDADFTLDIPIIKNKLSFFTSNRLVHFMPFLLASDILYKSNVVTSSVNLGFYDSYNKLIYQANDKLNFKILFYKNQDYYLLKENGNNNSEEKSRNNWGNTAINLASIYQVSNKLSIKNCLYFTRYSRLGEIEQLKNITGKVDSIINFSSTSGFINDFTLQSNLEYIIPKGKAVAGIHLLNREIIPSKFIAKNSSGTTLNFDKLHLNEYGLFAHFYKNITKNLQMDGGLRTILSKGNGFKYFNFEPRANLVYKIKNHLSSNLAFTKTTQSVFQAGGGLTGINDEYWFQVNEKIKPQIAYIYSSGFNYTAPEFTVKSIIFYKDMYRLLDAQIGILPSYYVSYDEVLKGISKEVRGHSYGFEFNMTRQMNNFFTSMSYTYSRSLRKHAEIFDGKPFPSMFDRPHVLNWMCQYVLNSNWSLSANFLFQSGMRYSKPIGYFHDLSNTPIPIYTERNNGQLIPYHRLDLGAMRKWTSKRGNKKQLWLNIINAYNRKNVSYIFPEYEQDRFSIKKVTLLPFFPTIAYSIEF